jgi:hypothetical protein
MEEIAILRLLNKRAIPKSCAQHRWIGFESSQGKKKHEVTLKMCVDTQNWSAEINFNLSDHSS